MTLTPDEMRARNTLKWTRHAPEILPLWVAEMDIETCPAVQDAIRSAVDRQTYGYPAGDTRLADATADWCARRYDWQIDPALVHAVPDVLVGVRAAIDHFTTPGSPIVLPVPAYMPFFDVLDVCGRRGAFVPMLTERGPEGSTAHLFDLTAIEAAFAAGAGGLVLCNPYNPLGAVFPAWHLAEICDLAARYGARIISDEIHAPLVYGRRHIPTASVSRTAAEVTVTVLASSKGFNTPGLKCAQVVLSNDADARRWPQVHRMRYEGVSTLGVEASIAAYREGTEWLDELLVFLAGNRDYLAETLPEAAPGLQWSPPQATFLAWLDFSDVGALGGADPSAWLLTEAKVFLNPGPAFGEGGRGHARLNFGTSRDILEEFVSRLDSALKDR